MTLASDPASAHDQIERPRGLVDWSDLLSVSADKTRDKRAALRIYTGLGLRPILLYGLSNSGHCMCRRDCGRSRGKHPVDTGWQRAAGDFSRIDRALAENLGWNIGLAMGVQPSGLRLLALDIDGPRETIVALEDELGALPPTLSSSTGRGMHLIFQVDAHRVFRNSTNVAGRKLDVRCDGGQIVAPPSRHYSGSDYAWLDAREPAVMP